MSASPERCGSRADGRGPRTAGGDSGGPGTHGPLAGAGEVLAGIAGSHMLRGDHPQAIEAAKAAIEEARATGTRLSEAHALNTLGTSTSLLGECGEGLRILRDAFDLTRELNDVDDRGRSYANLSSTLLICGAGEESLRVSLDGMAWARGVGATNGYGRFLAGNAVDAAVRVGRWDVAAELADDLMVSDVIGVNRLGMITVLGVFYARRGDTGEAERLLEEGRATVAPLHEAQFTGQVYVGLVELALTTGRADQAAAAAADGVDMISRTADRYYLLDVLTIAARAEADRAEVARAARDSSTATNAAEAARRYLETLESWLTEAPGALTYGGQLTAAVSLSAAEARRAEGVADPDAWRRAVDDIDRVGMAWPMAYARYRLGEALLTVRTPRREVAAVLGDAHIKAAGLGATRWWAGSRPLRADRASRSARRRRSRSRSQPTCLRRRPRPHRPSARSSRCSSRATRTGASLRSCSSARARPASTSRTSSASSVWRHERRPRRWPHGSAWSSRPGQVPIT